MRSRLLHEPARLAGASLLRLQSDERLAALARDGHEPAFAAIVHRYQAPLLRYCAGIVGPARADDAVQQAFINAHDALPRLTEVRHLKSWLHRIAHNVSLNTLRATRDEVEFDAGTAALSAQPADAHESAGRLRVTLQAVRDLPERQRPALLLREPEGRPHDEIPQPPGTTAGGAGQHLMRARAAVRQAATAITPYPLIAKLAGAVADPSAARVAEAVAGAGAGATVVKLTAGLAATGALVGGVVGTSAVTHRDPTAPAAAKVERVKRDGAGAKGRDIALVTSGLGARQGAGAGSSAPAAGHDDRRASGHGRDGERRRSGTSGTSGDDHPSSGEDRHSSGDDHGGTSGGDSSGSGSSGSGSSGSGSGDDRRSGSGSGSGSRDDGGRDGRPGSGTSGSGTSGSGTSGGGTSGSGDDHSGDLVSGTSGSGSSGSGSGGSGSDDGLSGSGSGSGDGTSTTTPTTTTPESHSGSGKSLPDDGVELPH